MKNSNNIICPNCNHEFSLNDLQEKIVQEEHVLNFIHKNQPVDGPKIKEDLLMNYRNDRTSLRKLEKEHKIKYQDSPKGFVIDDEFIVILNYPHLKYPTKIKSIDLLKINSIEGRLIAIKGQYLLFEENMAFNIRKHTGFNVQITIY